MLDNQSGSYKVTQTHTTWAWAERPFSVWFEIQSDLVCIEYSTDYQTDSSVPGRQAGRQRERERTGRRSDTIIYL